ncbi:MAG: TIGR03435 family protein [Candidatus Sulfopaludibacter sp.]|nr:TIGR03435 family protein [Candidatus Sulfopaludibacter sp.]
MHRRSRKFDCGTSLLLLAAGWASVAAGQTPSPAARPEFEVVSVKPAPPSLNGVSSRESVDNGLLTYTNFTLRRLIGNAYGVTEGQIVGPAWISDNLYHVQARLPAGASQSDVPAMLQGMLAERFKLAVERMKKKIPVYALVIAKGGHKMKPVIDGESGYGGGVRRIDGRGITMATLAKLLSSRVTDRPVIDLTGLGGKFAFRLEWAPEPDGPSVYIAVQEQLGLKLDPRRMLTEVITVTHAERNPTEN